MAKKKELLEFRIPQWAVCTLINDDPCEDDDDEKELNEFIEKIVEKYGNANFMLGDESEIYSFYWHNDICNMGDMCCTLYLFDTKND